MATKSNRISPAALIVALLFVFALSLSFTASADAKESYRAYGSLCSKYESSNNPADIDPSCAYGAYQMSTGNAYRFAEWLRDGAGKSLTNKNRATYIKWGSALLAAYVKDNDKCGKNFDKAWRAASTENSDLFFDRQYEYCKVHYYDEAVKYYWEKNLDGFKIDDYSKAFKSVLFSTAIQHGPYGSYYYIGVKGLNAVGGWQKGLAEDVLINAIYDERGKVVADETGRMMLAHFPGYYIDSNAGGKGIYNRLCINERADALTLMKKNGGICSHSSTKGGTNSYSVVSETKHTVHTSAVTCKSCGAVLKAATTKTVSHSFSFSGKNYKCACGQKHVVHNAKKHYHVKTELNLRSSASTSASIKASVPKGKILKALAAKKGSDGNWWLKVKVSGKTGYVRAHYMSIHGTGSASHVYSKGKCKYCHVAKSVLTKNKTAGTYKAASKVIAHSAAYGGSAKKSEIASGSQVVVTKVVKNCYNNLWGKTAKGYVDMKNLKRAK